MEQRAERSRSMGFILALGAVLALASMVRAEQPVRLAELEAHARKTRGALSGSDARIEGARARVAAARSAYSPTMNLLGEVSVAPGGRVIDVFATNGRDIYKVAGSKAIGEDGAFTPTPRYGVTLDVRSNLYDFGRTASAVEAAEAQRRAAQADAQQQELDIVRDVRSAYVRWATAYELWAVSERAAQAADERAKRMQAAIEEGATRSADRTAADADSGFARLELERARANLESARDDLGFLSLVDLPADARPADDVLQAGAPAAPAPSDDASLRALQEQKRAAEATADAHDHAFAPVIAVNAQAGVQGNMGNVFPLYRVGLSVSLPLWDGGAESANRGQARARAAELSAQATQYQQAREQRLKRSALLREQAERRIGVAKQLVELCGTRLSQLEEAYPLGAARFTDLADARAALSRAQTELVLAQAMRAEAALALY